MNRDATLAMIVLGLGFVGTTPAETTLIVHDNRDLSLRWEVTVDAFGEVIPGTLLDVRQEPNDQPGDAASASAFGFIVRDPITSNFVTNWDVFAANHGGGIAGGNVGVPVGDSFLFPAETFAIGSEVGPSETFVLEAPTTGFSFTETTPLIGDRAVVGVRFLLSGLEHYGWIELSVQPNGQYQPTGWAWETDAGVPAEVVAVPGAGTVAGLGLAGLGGVRRRR